MNVRRKIVLVVAWVLLVLATLFQPATTFEFGFVPIWDRQGWAISYDVLFLEYALIVTGAVVFYVVAGDRKP